ncbi:glycoside hydrolase family 28 protein [Brachybacterium sp. NBEC-018]|uniref:glycoside hydrolase family 28 protein n=1 Tax=Brachybacterium sp. NBEC-018 TaxID=2996004 RepID=UPI0021754F28|nr:glycoside hydrolase family 28 protein [Brachybacterium sp. NBEC-018]UVY84963.1 glycoside hydrolase family 28 protein [Brachybacterium sp. NBEC-018]
MTLSPPRDLPAGPDTARAAAGELATARLQSAIDDAAARGGGRVAVPAGVHRTGALRLRSRVELHLEAGALLQFVPDPALYPVVEARWEGATRPVHSPCLYAQDEEDVAITGLGTIDGGGGPWWDRQREGGGERPRPTLVGLHGCRRVTLRDVTLQNSPAWTVHPALCEQVTISGIRISNPADSPNTDGIDPESCRDVLISGCHIDVGDDCIAIKAGTQVEGRAVPCENVVVTGCTMVHGHGGVVIGSEMSGGVRNVVVSSCVLQGTDRGIRLKTRRGRGGLVEGLRVTNVVMDDVLVPVTVNSFYFCGEEGKAEAVGDRGPRPVDAGTPRLRGIHLAHLTATRVHASAGHIAGLPEAPIEDLTIEDLSVTFAERPRAGAPEMASGLVPVTREGLRVSAVAGGVLSGVRIRGAQGEPLLVDGSPDLRAEVTER